MPDMPKRAEYLHASNFGLECKAIISVDVEKVRDLYYDARISIHGYARRGPVTVKISTKEYRYDVKYSGKLIPYKLELRGHVTKKLEGHLVINAHSMEAAKKKAEKSLKRAGYMMDVKFEIERKD